MMPIFTVYQIQEVFFWQEITSGKHYSDEFVSRGILQPWVQVITELAREAAKTHYKDKKLHGKIERIHVDQGIDKKRNLTEIRPWTTGRFAGPNFR